MPDASEIPVLDLSLGHKDPGAQEAVRRGLGHFGLVFIQNHGIDKSEVHAFYDDFLEVCARPLEEKQTWSSGDVWYQRGWTPPNTEKAVVAGGQPDFKECFFVAPCELDTSLEDIYPEIYAANRWPRSSSRFQERYLAIGQQVHDVGLAVLRAAAKSLDLPTDTFVQMTTGAPHVSRALRYLPLDEEQVNTDILWGEEHTDFNLLTLLPGGRFIDPAGAPCARPDEGAGLYLRTRATPEHPTGQMVRGLPPEGCIVAQVGQQLEILTGGTFLATPHIIVPPKAPGYSRTAFAHFVHVHSLQRLFPLAPFRNPESIRSYGPPVLAGTYALKTLYDIGLAPKDALDQLGYRHYGRLASVRAD